MTDFLFSWGRRIISQALLAGLGLLLPAVDSGAANPEENYNIERLLAMSLEELVDVDIALATGTSKPLKLAPAIATVITAADLRAMGATSLEEALETVPGLHMSKSNLLNVSIFSLRGIHTTLSTQVLLQINGQPIKFTYSDIFPYQLRIPVSTISRIEVIRGPGSAVHGADAFSGTINVITKEAAEIAGTETGLRYGSFASQNGWLTHGSTLGGWEVVVGLDYFKTDGDNDRLIDTDLQTNLDQSLNSSFGLPAASLAPAPLATDHEQVDLRLGLVKDHWTARFWGASYETGLGVGFTPVLDSYGYQNMDIYQGDLLYDRADLLPGLDFTGRLNYLSIKNDGRGRLFPPGTLMPIGADGNLASTPTAGLVLFTDGIFGRPIVKEEQAALDLTGLYRGFVEHRLRLGVGGRHIADETDNYKNFGPGVIDTTSLAPPPAINEIDGTQTHLTNDSPYIFMNNQERNLWYVSLQDEWRFAEGWELTAGVRYDHYSDFGGTVNPRAALVWQTSQELTSKLLYGRAFRPPAFGELYNINNPSTLGNPDLAPETIETVELVFDFQPRPDLHTVLNLFVYQAEDFIESVPDPAPASTVTARNIRNQEGRGMELEADWLPIPSLRLRGNIAYQRSKDHDSGQVVANAPEWQAYLNSHWTFWSEWSLDGQYFWVGQRHRAAGDSRDDVKDNDWVNLTLRRNNVLAGLDLSLAVRNLFDEDIREPTVAAIANDLPMEGRAVWGEISAHF